MTVRLAGGGPARVFPLRAPGASGWAGGLCEPGAGEQTRFSIILRGREMIAAGSSVMRGRRRDGWLGFSCWVLLMLLPGGLLPCARVRADVVEQGKRATALVDLGERGSGSAFCIDPAGLFVTNWHVVADREHGETVKVVMEGGQPDQKAFEAAVVGVDPEVDIALLRAKEAENLAALELGDDAALTETVEVTAFGYPFGKWLTVGEKLYPAVSINKGRVAALRKEEGKLALIQIDASINPGNSGGPVLDANGRVVGVVVATAMFGSGVNFIVPVSRLKAFLEQPHFALDWGPIAYADRYEPAGLMLEVISHPRAKAADLAVELVLSVGLGDRRVVKLERESPTTFRARTRPVPKDLGAGRVGLRALGRNGATDGWSENRRITFGDTKVALRDVRVVDAQPTPHAEMRDGRKVPGSMAALGTMTTMKEGEIRDVDLSKAVLVEVSELDPDERRVHYTIVARRGGDEVNRVKGTMRFEGAPAPAEPDEEARRRAMIEALARYMAAKTKIKTESETLDFPYDLQGVAAVGGGGKYLLLHLGSVRKLAILDVASGHVDGYVPLPSEEALVTAGVEKLVVASPRDRTLERWDLASRAREAEAKLEDVGTLTGLAMGSASAGPVLVTGKKDEPKLVDLATLKPMKVFFSKNLKGWEHCRASANGKTFTGWGSRDRFYGSCWIQLVGDQMVGRHVRRGFGPLLPSHDGLQFFARHEVLSRRLEELPIPRDEMGWFRLLPTGHPRLLAGFGAVYGPRGFGPRLRLLGADDRRLVCWGPTLWNMVDREVMWRDEQPLDQRIMALPGKKVIATVPPSNDRLVLYRYDWMEALEKTDRPYLLVASSPPTTVLEGRKWAYKLDVRSSEPEVRYRLLSGPRGMDVSSEGIVSWDVPERLESDVIPLAIEVSAAKGRRLVHRASLKPHRDVEGLAAVTVKRRKKPLEVIPHVNVYFHARVGTWLPQADGLRVTTKGRGNTLQLPVFPKDNYRLRVEFTLMDGEEVFIVFPVAGHRCSLVLGGWGGACGLDDIERSKGRPNPTRVGGFSLEKNRRYAAELFVRRGGPLVRIQAMLDGREILHWVGKPGRLKLPDHFRYKRLHADQPAIGTYRAEAVFHRIVVHSLDEDSRVSRELWAVKQMVDLTEVDPIESRTAPPEPVDVDSGGDSPVRCLRVRPDAGGKAAVTYRVDKAFDLVTGRVFPTKLGPDAHVAYRIVGDGKELWSARIGDGEEAPRHFTVPVGHVEALELIAEGFGASQKAARLWGQPRLVTCYGTLPLSPDFPIWEELERFLKEDKPLRSDAIGGKGARPFEHIPKEGGLLAGVELTTGQSGGKVVIKSLRPIFFTRRGYVEGPVFGKGGGYRKALVARPGYVVAGMDVYSAGQRVNAVTLRFHRLRPDGLDLEGSYSDGWGSNEVRKRTGLYEEGRPVIGIHGRCGDDIDALGVIFGPEQRRAPASPFGVSARRLP